MKRSRFTEEQIIGILKEQEAGAATADDRMQKTKFALNRACGDLV